MGTLDKNTNGDNQDAKKAHSFGRDKPDHPGCRSPNKLLA
jgi:hypothetical protein